MTGMDRRGFLSCMAWTGTGLVWAVTGGVLSSRSIAHAAGTAAADFTFVQISDSHLGFKGEANPDTAATLREVVTRINALTPPPAFVLHTGDLTHGQKAGAFDAVNEILKEARVEQVFFVPGEHDVFLDGGTEFLARFGGGTTGQGWRSFDYRGAHLIGLVNVLKYKGEGIGSLGDAQLEWLEKDLAPLPASTPLIVYAHVPLWSVYPKWGWATEDGGRALEYLKRFGSVTVLNGHIHQTLQKVEGTVSFYTAMSTAFPQPTPGSAPAPGPMKIRADQARHRLGLREIRYVPGRSPLAVIDTPLA